jgi:hypothetical protein
VENDRLLRISPGYGLDSLTDHEVGAQLFAQLPMKAFLQGLADLALAPGELPEAFEMGAGGPPSDEVAASFVPDQAGRDLDDLRLALRRGHSGATAGGS